MIALQQQRNKTKTTKGRQKIPIKRLQDENSRQVTFSKRRNGLFKKASELCILTGARIGIITFSPHSKPYCFGHPDIETVLEAYLGHQPLDQTFPGQGTRTEQLCYRQLNQQHEAALQQLQEEKRRSAALLEEKETGNGRGFWWEEACVERIDGVEELEEFARALIDLRNNLSVRCNELTMMSGATAGDGFGDQCGCARGGGSDASSSGLGLGVEAFDALGFDHGLDFDGGEFRNWNLGVE